MAKPTVHPLTRATYQAESPDAVRVSEGDQWGRFDRFGGWLEGPLRQCDPQMCIWLAGLALVEQRSREAAA